MNNSIASSNGLCDFPRPSTVPVLFSSDGPCRFVDGIYTKVSRYIVSAMPL